jgi:4-hydroxybenzoyl-CoA reductase subunit beta
MLRLPRFRHEAPASVEEAAALLAEHKGRARLLAGGTDLLPNLKHGIEEADVVVSLGRVPGLNRVRETEDGGLELGAMLSLEALASDVLVRKRYPALATAAGLVAGPHHRRMGTLGGNVCLNTRCVYINQTHFWREALGYCLKKDGEACHVVKGGKRCVAAASNDTAPVLTTLGASLRLRSHSRGVRALPIAEFYVQDGVNNKALEPDELLESVVIPMPQSGLHGAYKKLRPRDSIDFPRLSVAVAFRLESDVVRDLRIVVSALAARPLMLKKVGDLSEGRPLNDELLDELGSSAFKQCHPLTNIDGDATYRRDMVPVYVKRALRAARDSGASTP